MPSRSSQTYVSDSCSPRPDLIACTCSTKLSRISPPGSTTRNDSQQGIPLTDVGTSTAIVHQQPWSSARPSRLPSRSGPPNQAARPAAPSSRTNPRSRRHDADEPIPRQPPIGRFMPRSILGFTWRHTPSGGPTVAARKRAGSPGFPTPRLRRGLSGDPLSSPRRRKPAGTSGEVYVWPLTDHATSKNELGTPSCAAKSRAPVVRPYPAPPPFFRDAWAARAGTSPREQNFARA